MGIGSGADRETWTIEVRPKLMKFFFGVICGVAAVVGFQSTQREEKRNMSVDLAEYHVKELWQRFYQVDPKVDTPYLKERKDLGSAEVFFLESKSFHDTPPGEGILDGECYMKLVRSKELPNLISGHANNSAPEMEMDKSALKATDKAYAELLKANEKYLAELDRAIKIGFKSKMH